MSPNYGLRLEKCSLKECLPKKSLEVAQFLAFIQQRQLSCTTYFIFVNCNHYDVGIHNRNLQNPLKKKINICCLYYYYYYFSCVSTISAHIQVLCQEPHCWVHTAVRRSSSICRKIFCFHNVRLWQFCPQL